LLIDGIDAGYRSIAGHGFNGMSRISIHPDSTATPESATVLLPVVWRTRMRLAMNLRSLALLSLAALLAGAGCASASSSTEKSPKQEAENVGLLVRLEAKPGKEDEVLKFLQGGLPIVQGEPATTRWFALRFGPSSFGIFDTFPGEAGRQAHLNGQVAAALMAQAPELFSTAPVIEPVELLATKAPGAVDARVHKALVVILEAKPGKEAEVQQFLEGGLPIVRGEPATTHWYAIRLSPTRFGIVDTFPSDEGRQAHLNGQVAAALMAKSSDMLARPPAIEQVDVLAAKP
jgi:quinol monooxygenase YgiN